MPESEVRPAALVTGSSRGIGRATALRLAISGHDVAVHGLVDDSDLAEVTKAVEAAGARCVRLSGDVSDPGVVHDLISTTTAAFGRLDALVNNAGAGLTKPFVEIDMRDWQRLFAVHVEAAALGCQLAYPELARSGGAVVNLSSVAARQMVPYRVAYAAAKSAVEGMTRALACEWAPHGVRVNAIAPGTILTPLVEENFSTGRLDPDRVLERTPMQRFGTPEEVAEAVTFLLSDHASYITGQVLGVDGAWSIWGGWS